MIGEAISGLLNFNPARAAACRPSGAAPLQRSGLGVSNWLGNLDSNQDKQSQSLLCYRYTIPQCNYRTNSITYGIVRQQPAKRLPPSRRCAVLPATCRTWQARGETVFRAGFRYWPARAPAKFQAAPSPLAVCDVTHFVKPIAALAASRFTYPNGAQARPSTNC